VSSLYVDVFIILVSLLVARKETTERVWGGGGGRAQMAGVREGTRGMGVCPSALRR